MAIRDRLRNALRNSISSDGIFQTSSNSTTASNTTSTTLSSDGSEEAAAPSKPRPTNRLARALTWSRDKSKDLPKEKLPKLPKSKRNPPPALHPRDRPLTVQNLKHQQMLGQFTMTFGSSDNRMSQVISSPSLGEVSPGCSRRGSFDYGPTSPVSPSTQMSFEPRRFAAEV